MSTPSEVQPKLRGRKKSYYIILIFLLLFVNAFLLYNNLKDKSSNNELTAQNQELNEEKAKLMVEIDALSANLESQKGDNQALNNEIEAMQSSLDSLKNVYNLRLNNRNAQISDLKKDLTQAKEEFEKTKNGYLEDIADLQQQIQLLETENENLTETLEVTKQYSEELEGKVEKGQVMSLASLSAFGIREKNNNKIVETNIAKKTERIKVCFTFNNNRIAESGDKDILLRIISPEGTSLAVEALGSGTFTLAESGENSLYTSRQLVPFDSESNSENCIYWTQDMAYGPGTYTVEIYHKGYLIGSTSLTLKKRLL